MKLYTLPRMTPGLAFTSLGLAVLLRWLGGDSPHSMAIAPAILKALISMGPGLLSKLFGSDPQAELRKKAGKLTSAQNVSKETEMFLKQILGSAAFSQAQGSIAQGANATQGQLSSELGSRGIGTSGTGAILSSIVPSIVGGQQASLRTGAYQSAQGQAMDKIKSDLATLMGTSGPSQSSQLFAGGLEGLGPLLKMLLAGKVRGPAEAYRDPGYAPSPEPRGSIFGTN